MNISSVPERRLQSRPNAPDCVLSRSYTDYQKGGILENLPQEILSTEVSCRKGSIQMQSLFNFFPESPSTLSKFNLPGGNDVRKELPKKRYNIILS